MPKLSDIDAHASLKGVAVGRTAKEMGQLLHAAHEEVLLEEEAAKHGELATTLKQETGKGATIRPDGSIQRSPAAWDAETAFLLDGGATNHIDVAVGLALVARLAGNQQEWEFKLRMLFKACLRAFPHVRQVITPAPEKESK